MGQRTAGDQMFERHLAEHDYANVEHEPDLGVQKRPDYLIEREAERCVVEVKSFDASMRSMPDQPFGSTDVETVLKPVRTQLRESARQLWRRRLFSHLTIDEALPRVCGWPVGSLALTQIGRSAPPPQELEAEVAALCPRARPAYDGLELAL